MLFGRLVAMLVAGTLVALVPLAHASPPDPTWISAFTTTLTTTMPCSRSPRESASQRMTDRPTWPQAHRAHLSLSLIRRGPASAPESVRSTALHHTT